MAAVSYLPGEWLAVVRAGTAVVLPSNVDPQLVERLWALLGSEPGVHTVLDAVTAGFGTGLTGLPNFGVVEFKDRLRVLLRGEMDLQAHSDGGSTNVSGRDVATWSERTLVRPDRFRLTLGTAQHDGGGLPLVEAVVRLGALEVDLAGGGLLQPRPMVPAAAEKPDLNETLVGTPEEPDTPPEVIGTPEFTSNYDHLWEQTVIRSVEDAAVRAEDEGHAEEAEEAKEPAPVPEPSAGEAPATPEPVTPAPVVDPALVVDPAPAAPASGGRPESSGSDSGLIEFVPWLRTAQPSSPTKPQAPTPQAPTEPQVPTEPRAGAPRLQQPSAEGDHDGQTVLRSDLDLPAAPAAPAADEARAQKTPSTGPVVLARLCPRGHANPPTNSVCSLCGKPVEGDAREVKRPLLGRVRISTGELIELEQSLVIGRQPSVSRVQGSGMPRLVQVRSLNGDISRSHVEVRLEGWHVLLCDLKATNGTVLVRQGQPPRRLAQGETAILLDGDIAELGDGISLRFEDIL